MIFATVDLAVRALEEQASPPGEADPAGGAAMSWRARFRVRQYVKSSLWLAPLIAGLGGLVLAELTYALDMRSDLAVLQYSPETATAVVSATIAAVVSLTGFVVTVTVLGVQQATGIFSPRYMRLWYRDGRLKLVLAELVGTLMFSISVIRRIQPDAVPDISVSLAGWGLTVGLLLFLLYFDRFLHRMRPVAVAALLADQGRHAFEEWMEEAARPDTAFVARGSWTPATAPTFVLRATRSGTIQAVDTAGLTAFARQPCAAWSCSATPSATSCRWERRSSRSTGRRCRAPPAGASRAWWPSAPSGRSSRTPPSPSG